MKHVFGRIGSLLVATAIAFPAFAQRVDGGWYGHGWGHMFFGGLMMLLFWGGLIVLVVAVVRGFGRSDDRGRADASGSTALEILQKRYARGEIEQEEYEQRRRKLEE